MSPLLGVSIVALVACGGGGDGGTKAGTSGVGAVAVGEPGPDPAVAPAVPIGTRWAATGPQDVWHSLAVSADGRVMVAGQAETVNAASNLYLSTDGGENWIPRPALGSGIWISSDLSADGNRIAAVQFNGAMFLSSDRGATFAQVPLPTGTDAQAFEAVTLSHDGTRIAALVMNGPVFVGDIAADGTVTWRTTAGLPTAAAWRWIDSSADGRVMVAVAQDPAAFVSRDGGATWRPLAVSVSGSQVLDQNWYRVGVSSDGNTIAMVANAFGGVSGNGIYISKDGGQTFSRPHAHVTDYSSLAVSADGGFIAATHSPNNDPAAGQVLLSTDGGASFVPVAITVGGAPVADGAWRAVAMSAGADRMAIAAGSFRANVAGRIYLSTGGR